MRSSALLLVALAASCGNGVDDLTLTAAPLEVLHGHVDRSALPSELAGTPLRAALVWGLVPDYTLACLKYPDNAYLQAVCPDPFDFVPGAVDVEVPVPAEGDGSFALPIPHLPDASVAVGPSGASMAWGSLIVVADTGGTGAIDLLGYLQDGTLGPANPIVAASFYSLHAPQQRIGFREGTFDPGSTFYPLANCSGPPIGFSILATPGYLPPGLVPSPGDCSTATLDAVVVEAKAISATESTSLACRAINDAPVTQPGADSPLKVNLNPLVAKNLVCLDSKTVALIIYGTCPLITVMPLAGCEGDLTCTQPEWDLTQQPPAWWPCGS